MPLVLLSSSKYSRIQLPHAGDICLPSYKAYRLPSFASKIDYDSLRIEGISDLVQFTGYHEMLFDITIQDSIDKKICIEYKYIRSKALCLGTKEEVSVYLHQKGVLILCNSYSVSRLYLSSKANFKSTLINNLLSSPDKLDSYSILSNGKSLESEFNLFRYINGSSRVTYGVAIEYTNDNKIVRSKSKYNKFTVDNRYKFGIINNNSDIMSSIDTEETRLIDDFLFDICSKYFLFVPVDNNYILSKADILLSKAQEE